MSEALDNKKVKETICGNKFWSTNKRASDSKGGIKFLLDNNDVVT